MQELINVVSLAIFTTVLAIGRVMFKWVGLAIRGCWMFDGLLSVLATRRSISRSP
jgi:hypothetical protein